MDNTKKYTQAWEKVYQTTNPFDLDAPYEWIFELEKDGKIHGKILDSGSGAGHNSIYLASKGYEVIGVDISSGAIEKAKQKAGKLQINNVQFIVANVAGLKGYDQQFDTVIDIGCFHSLEVEDYHTYTTALHNACRQGAIIYLRAFSNVNKDKETYSGPAVSEEQIRQAFSNGWDIKKLWQEEIEMIFPGKKSKSNYAWFAEIHYLP
jgi:cyclopropane fatty-acyl-phospholipid synthase-like methyltransferase